MSCGMTTAEKPKAMPVLMVPRLAMSDMRTYKEGKGKLRAAVSAGGPGHGRGTAGARPGPGSHTCRRELPRLGLASGSRCAEPRFSAREPLRAVLEGCTSGATSGASPTSALSDSMSTTEPVLLQHTQYDTTLPSIIDPRLSSKTNYRYTTRRHRSLFELWTFSIICERRLVVQSALEPEQSGERGRRSACQREGRPPAPLRCVVGWWEQPTGRYT